MGRRRPRARDGMSDRTYLLKKKEQRTRAVAAPPASASAAVVVLLLLLLGCDTGGAFRPCPPPPQRPATRPPLRSSCVVRAASATAAIDDGSRSALDRLLPPLPPEQLVEYLRKGHTVVRGLFSQEEVLDLKPRVMAAFEAEQLDALRHEVRVFFGDEAYAACRTVAACKAQLAQKGEDDITPFLQVFNSWRRHEALRPLAFSKRLGHVAAQLMGVPQVRLYQDSLFYKRPGDDETLWHMDLATAPLDTNAFVTVWIPLTPVPAPGAGGSPLRFLTGSHADKAKDYWYDPHESDDDAMFARYPLIEDHAPLALGDATFHNGWILHGSPPNRLPEPRVALSFAYAAADARTLGEDALFLPDHEDEISYEEWLEEVGEGGVIDHPLTPVVYP